MCGNCRDDDWPVKTIKPAHAHVETPDGSKNRAIHEAPTAELTIGVEFYDLAVRIGRAVDACAVVVMPPTDNGLVDKSQLSDHARNLINVVEYNKHGA